MKVVHRWLAGIALLVPFLTLADEPYPLEAEVGKTTVSVCKTNTIICPVGAARCDDLSVAIPALTDEGLVFKGVGLGTTLCSAGGNGGEGKRMVYRVTVVPEKPPAGSNP